MIQKTPRIDAYKLHMDRARATLARGFTAKSHQKDGMDYCNRAFEDAMELIGEALLKARDDGSMDDKSKEWRDLYYSRPQAHVWNAKKAAPFVKHFPEFVALANDAAALRAQIKDTSLVAKKPSARQQKIAVEDAKRMNCQVCARPILAETGKIAHHGYERPGTGWQTQSCYGALRLPYEVDRSAILELIPGVISREKSLREYIKNVRGGNVDAHRDRLLEREKPKIEHRAEFTREMLAVALKEHPRAFGDPPLSINADGNIYDYHKNAYVAAYDYYLDRALALSEINLRQATDWRKYLEKRRDEWKVTHKWTGEEWVKL